MKTTYTQDSKKLSDRILFLSRSGHFKTGGLQKLEFFIREKNLKCHHISTTGHLYQDKTFSDYSIEAIEIVKQIKEYNPTIIAISLLSHDYIYFVDLLNKFVKTNAELASNILFTFGGVGVITNPEFILYSFSFLSRILIIPTYGEPILDKILNHETLDDLMLSPDSFPSCILKIDSRIVKSEKEIKNSDIKNSGRYTTYLQKAISIQYDSLIMKNKNGIIPSNGEYRSTVFPIYIDLACAGSCNFCSMSNKDYKKLISIKSISKFEITDTINEIITVIKIVSNQDYNGRFLINNDDFFSNKAFVIPFINRLIQLNESNLLNGWDFWATARCRSTIENIDETTLKQLSQLGFTISLGTETFDKNFLQDMGKPTYIKENYNAIAKLINNGIGVSISSLICFPSVTMEIIDHDLNEYIALYQKYNSFKPSSLGITLNTILLATHNTHTSMKFANCIQYETIVTIDGKKKIPKYILPKNKDTNILLTELLTHYNKLRRLLKQNLADLILTRTFESLIYLTLLSATLEHKTYVSYKLELIEFVKKYPVKYQKHIMVIINNYLEILKN